MASIASSLQPFHKQFPDKFRSHTIFGQYEKIYRRPPSLKRKSKEFIQLQSEEAIKLAKVVDFDQLANNELHHQNNIHVLSSRNGLNMYGYRGFDGLFYIPNYLNTTQQYDWIKQSIQQFSNAPYNNLSNLYQQQQNTYKDKQIPTWQDAVQQNNFKSFRQLTWANVGIQYDWTEREYNLQTITAPIPQSMINLCDDCNALLGDLSCNNEQKVDDDGVPFSMQIVPQTSIINFYEVNAKRPMGGHKDAAELINAPLISVSLGNDAIFLISNDDNVAPLALWVRSGCVLIMARKARFALHCVARVVRDSCPKALLKYFDNEIDTATEKKDKKELELMKKYVMESRINFNIRQVIEVDKLLSSCSDEPELTENGFHEIQSF
eukprot:165712_1